MIHYRSVFLAVSILIALSACATKPQDSVNTFPSDQSQSKTPFEQLSFGKTRKIAFEDEGTFLMVEGSECIQRDKGPESATMLLFVDMPNYVDSGTVVLNGWDLRYLHRDHEVRSMRADITHSKLVTGSGGAPILVFEVAGELSDQNSDDSYEFCIYYTGIGYNSDSFDASIVGDFSGIDTRMLQTENEGAVATLENIWADDTPTEHDTIAVIPRGFDFKFSNKFECELRLLPCRWKDSTDHRLRQIAYSLFQIGATPNPNNNPHWVTQTIFKDNNTRAHWAKTRAALIGGSSVKLHPDLLALNAKSGKTNNCHKGTNGIVRTETVQLYDLPYDYAVPMLTGWDLNYECSNQHVQRAGIWLHDIHFDPDSNGLEYKVSSILRDKDGAPGFNSAHRVTVLGLNRLPPPPPPIKRSAPDIKIKLRHQ